MPSFWPASNLCQSARGAGIGAGRTRGGSGPVGQIRDSGFRCKRFDGACTLTWDRRQSRPHTAYGRRIFLLRARLVDLRTQARHADEFTAQCRHRRGARAFGALQGHRAALTAFGVLDKPAAVGTVVGAAVPLLRFPRRAQVHDGELVRLGGFCVGVGEGLGRVRIKRGAEEMRGYLAFISRSLASGL